MIGRADIEESKSNVAMNAWLPQASYPCLENKIRREEREWRKQRVSCTDHWNVVSQKSNMSGWREMIKEPGCQQRKEGLLCRVHPFWQQGLRNRGMPHDPRCLHTVTAVLEATQDIANNSKILITVGLPVVTFLTPLTSNSKN